jgi:hypothetical protein
MRPNRWSCPAGRHSEVDASQILRDRHSGELFVGELVFEALPLDVGVGDVLGESCRVVPDPLPANAMTAGTRVSRTTKASTNTPAAKLKPIALIVGSLVNMKATKMANMIIAAAVTTCADGRCPVALRGERGRWWCIPP